MPGSAPGGGRDSAELEISKIDLNVHKDHIVAMLKVAVTLHHIQECIMYESVYRDINKINLDLNVVVTFCCK